MIDELMERYDDFRDKHAKEKVKLGSYRSRQIFQPGKIFLYPCYNHYYGK
ncbi:hypothetical protein [Butyrivibrio sp. FCS014]|nr:hypothetical protein [Butyrivibrio sp. FCS014]